MFDKTTLFSDNSGINVTFSVSAQNVSWGNAAYNVLNKSISSLLNPIGATWKILPTNDVTGYYLSESDALNDGANNRAGIELETTKEGFSFLQAHCVRFDEFNKAMAELLSQIPDATRFLHVEGSEDNASLRLCDKTAHQDDQGWSTAAVVATTFAVTAATLGVLYFLKRTCKDKSNVEAKDDEATPLLPVRTPSPESVTNKSVTLAVPREETLLHT